MIRKWTLICALAMLTSAACFAQGEGVATADAVVTVPIAALPTLASTHARFARLVASPDYGTALWLVFDESGGTGKGYDRMYADLNYDGCFGAGEMSRGNVEKLMTLAFGGFPAILVADPSDPDQLPGEKTRVTISYQTSGDKASFSVATVLRMDGASGQPNDFWQYKINGDLPTGISVQGAPLTTIGGEPALALDLRPDGRELGIGVTLTAGGMSCTPSKGGASPDVHVTVKDQNGHLVAEKTASLDQFCFG